MYPGEWHLKSAFRPSVWCSKAECKYCKRCEAERPEYQTCAQCKKKRKMHEFTEAMGNNLTVNHAIHAYHGMRCDVCWANPVFDGKTAPKVRCIQCKEERELHDFTTNQKMMKKRMPKHTSKLRCNVCCAENAKLAQEVEESTQKAMVKCASK